MTAEESGAGLTTKVPTVLIVCAGNLCRSPAAEFLLRSMLGPAAAGFQIHSAGTEAAEGAPIDPVIAELLSGRGIDASGFRSRPATPALLASADLILTASATSGAAVGALLPTTTRRAVTVKKLARYAPFIAASGEPPPGGSDRIAWLLRALPTARAQASGTRHGDDDIADPVGRSRGRYVAAFAESERACAAIAPLLATGLVVAPSAERPRTDQLPDLPDPQPQGTRFVRPGGSAQAARSFFEWAFD